MPYAGLKAARMLVSYLHSTSAEFALEKVSSNSLELTNLQGRLSLFRIFACAP